MEACQTGLFYAQPEYNTKMNKKCTNIQAYDKHKTYLKAQEFSLIIINIFLHFVVMYKPPCPWESLSQFLELH